MLRSMFFVAITLASPEASISAVHHLIRSKTSHIFTSSATDSLQAIRTGTRKSTVEPRA